MSVQTLSDRDFSESFPSNFLASVAFEARFDPFLAIQNSISEFQKQIRGEYPLIERGFAVQLGPPAPSFQAEPSEWKFSSKDGTRQVRIAIDKYVVVFKRYQTFQEFSSEIHRIINTMSELTGIDSYTRVGIRFVNEIELKNEEPPTIEILRLFNPLLSHDTIKERNPFKFSAEIRYRYDDSCMTTTWNRYFESPEKGRLYVLDIDAFTEEQTPHGALLNLSKRLHELAVQEFHKGIQSEFVELLRSDTA